MTNPKPDDVPWSEALTLEDWMKDMLAKGYTEIVLNVLKLLPEERKVYYREIYKNARKRGDA